MEKLNWRKTMDYPALSKIIMTAPCLFKYLQAAFIHDDLKTYLFTMIIECSYFFK